MLTPHGPSGVAAEESMRRLSAPPVSFSPVQHAGMRNTVLEPSQWCGIELNYTIHTLRYIVIGNSFLALPIFARLEFTFSSSLSSLPSILDFFLFFISFTRPAIHSVFFPSFKTLLRIPVRLILPSDLASSPSLRTWPSKPNDPPECIHSTTFDRLHSFGDSQCPTCVGLAEFPAQ